MPPGARTAIVHDWLVVRAGAERVLDAILELHPGSPVFTLVHDRKSFEGSELARHPVCTSFLQRLPRARSWYRQYLPLMPVALEQFDLTAFDIVISSTQAVAHGVVTDPAQLHLAYFNRTMRYAWDLYHQELKGFGVDHGVKGQIARLAYHYIRLWDYQAFQRPDVIVANSRYAARRIQKYYRRDAQVIYPPVDIGGWPLREGRGDWYVASSRLVPHKRMDVVVAAFSRLRLPLKVLGDGPLRERLAQDAGPNVEFVGWLRGAELRECIGGARALVTAADEEFGIAAVEAQAAGRPVIGYAGCGLSEIVQPGETGLLFERPTVDSLMEAVRAYESGEFHFDPERIRANAERFDRPRFQRELGALLDEQWERRWAPGRRVWSLPVSPTPREPEATQPATTRLRGI
jgi:glycosyltransferase involved in cell wall biosynthesis